MGQGMVFFIMLVTLALLSIELKSSLLEGKL